MLVSHWIFLGRLHFLSGRRTREQQDSENSARGRGAAVDGFKRPWARTTAGNFAASADEHSLHRIEVL